MDKYFELVGHRGWPEKFPENSLPGIRAALDFGAKGIEFDIQMSADGVPVLIHDENLLRTCEQDLLVGDLDYDVLGTISCHESARFGDKHYPCPLISLESLCDTIHEQVNKQQCVLYVEIKQESFENFSRIEILEAVIKATELIDKKNRVIISFDFDIVALARNIYEENIGWVLETYCDESREKAESLRPEYLICNYKKIAQVKDRHVTEKLWQGDWLWFVYDLVDRSLLPKLMEIGVDVIETWDLDALNIEQL